MNNKIIQSAGNLMSLEGYFSATDDFSQKTGQFKAQAENFVNQQRGILENQITKAKTNKTLILKLFNVDSVEQLNTRIKSYEKTIINLSGPQLKKAFLSGGTTKVQGYDMDEIQKAIREATDIALSDDEIVDYDAVLNTALNAIHQELQGVRNLQVVGKVGTTAGGKKFINVGKLTKKQKQALNGLLKKYKAKGGKKIMPKQFEIENQTKKSADDEVDIETDFNWLEATQGLTPTEAAKGGNMSDQEVDRTIELIKQRIVQEAHADNPQLLSNILDHILTRSRYAFFVGNNFNDVVGLLGEIKGMYYLSKLLSDGGSPEVPQEWIGGVADGAKPHRDIILNKLFGVQVKNTAANITTGFTSYFSQGKLDNIISKMGGDLDETIRRYYAVKSFNVPYHITPKTQKAASGITKSGKKAQAAKNYLQRRKSIEELDGELQKVISTYAASLMYINADEELDKKGINPSDKNDLYFIAGKSLIFAADILQTIYDQLYPKEKQIMRSSFHTKSSSSMDIISAYNSGNREMSLSEIVANTNITTSFNFAL